MDRVSIRDLSADVIRSHTSSNEVLGVTSKGALVGVLVPLTHEVLQRVATHEAHDLAARAADVDAEAEVSLSDLRDVLQDSAPPRGRPSHFARVSIREISSARLEQASLDGMPLVVTSDRVAVAVFLPVGRDWVERLVEESVARFITGRPAERSAATRRGDGTTVKSVESIPAPRRRLTSLRAIGIRIVEDALVERKRVVGLVTDGLAEIKVDQITLPLEQLEPGYVFDQILALVEKLESRMPDPDKLVGVGIEVGGHVHRGRVVRSANIHWSQFALAAQLQEEIGMPVVLENDANALAIYEQRQGISADDFAVVLLTNVGIGCGLVLGGRLHRGIRGMAAELGHIPIETTASDGPWCRCGNRGCLECAVTPRSILAMLREKNFTGNYEDALNAAEDPRVRDAFKHAGTALGKGIATVLNLLNPEAVVLYGPMDVVGPPRDFHIEDRRTAQLGATAKRVHQIYTEAMADNIRSQVFSNADKDCQFIVRTRSDQQGARAAATCVIHESRDLLSARPRGIVSPHEEFSR